MPETMRATFEEFSPTHDFLTIGESSAMSWETIFVLTGMLCGAYWALTRKPRR